MRTRAASQSAQPTLEAQVKAYLKERARLIDRTRAGNPRFGTPGGGTVYLTTADASGMMVSYIQSNYQGFGSGVVVPGTGISMQNRGIGFVLTEGHVNQVGPRKRPFHNLPINTSGRS